MSSIIVSLSGRVFFSEVHTVMPLQIRTRGGDEDGTRRLRLISSDSLAKSRSDLQSQL